MIIWLTRPKMCPTISASMFIIIASFDNKWQIAIWERYDEEEDCTANLTNTHAHFYV